MKASDTVMSEEELDKLPSVDSYPSSLGSLSHYFREGKRQIAQRQAEISFNAGVMSVVEAIHDIYGDFSHTKKGSHPPNR